MSARFTRRNHGKGHSYLLDGHKVPGVTTVIGTLDKPALVGWAAKETAAHAIEHWDELSRLPLASRLERLEKARFNTNRTAIIRGNRVHALADKLVRGEPVEVPAELAHPVETYARFLDANELETIAAEAPVASTEWRYAGTLDLICRSPKHGVILMDLKTGKGAYSETALQLAAYRNADLMLETEETTGPRGGKKTITHEVPMPSVDRAAIAHLPVGADQVSWIPVKTDESVSNTFLYLLEVYESWIKRTGWEFRNEETADRVLGDAVWPEDEWPEGY